MVVLHFNKHTPSRAPLIINYPTPQLRPQTGHISRGFNSNEYNRNFLFNINIYTTHVFIDAQSRTRERKRSGIQNAQRVGNQFYKRLRK